jgi:hypothetical protein
MKWIAKGDDPTVILAQDTREGTELEKTWSGEAAVTEESQHAAIDSAAILPESQYGIQKIEATTSAWTVRDLIIVYVL